MIKKEVNKSEIEKLYGQLGISPKSNNLEDYPFFNTKKDKHLAWKPLII